jgi:hypothetical protein
MCIASIGEARLVSLKTRPAELLDDAKNQPFPALAALIVAGGCGWFPIE